MPYEIRQLLKDLREPVIASPEELISDALDRMLDKQFSQLPVVKENKDFYFVTYERILTTFASFGSRVDASALLVKDALIKIPTVYTASDDLFDLLSGIRDMNATVIVDDQRNLMHVVTSYDTTLYFRQMAGDIIQVRDIEHRLRRIINSAFKKVDGTIDEAARKATIEEIISAKKDLRKKFELALQRYLKSRYQSGVALTSETFDKAFLVLLNGSPSNVEDVTTGVNGVDPENLESQTVKSLTAVQLLRRQFEAAVIFYLAEFESIEIHLDPAQVDDAFRVIYDRDENLKDFNELTMDEYIKVFFKDVCWERCHDVFRIGQADVRNMLESVRNTRNHLAHFQEEKVTAQKRQQLKTCADWLSENEALINNAFEKTAPY